jgi:hypothetical protein
MIVCDEVDPVRSTHYTPGDIMRPFIVLAAVVMATQTADAQAAPVAFPRPGTRVRVTSVKADTAFGMVTQSTSDSLWLSDRRFGRSEVMTVATWERDRGAGARKGLKWGAGIGGLMLLAGIVSDATADPCHDIVCVPATAVAGFFAMISTGLGAALGAGSAKYEWKPVR